MLISKVQCGVQYDGQTILRAIKRNGEVGMQYLGMRVLIVWMDSLEWSLMLRSLEDLAMGKFWHVDPSNYLCLCFYCILLMIVYTFFYSNNNNINRFIILKF